jgi:uncharacterized protein YlxW (UPF0749 family)
VCLYNYLRFAQAKKKSLDLKTAKKEKSESPGHKARVRELKAEKRDLQHQANDLEIRIRNLERDLEETANELKKCKSIKLNSWQMKNIILQLTYALNRSCGQR